MKIQMSFVLALVCALIISACGGSGSSKPIPADLTGFTMSDIAGTNTSIAQKVNASGLVIESGYVVNGNRNGQWATYDEEGKILTLCNYVDGKKSGEDLKFSKRGQIEVRTAYLNNQLNGIVGTYKNGRPVQEVSYKDGMLDGPTYKYFNNGKLQQEINYKNNKQDGAFKYFDEDGKVTLEYMYKNGEKVSGGIVK